MPKLPKSKLPLSKLPLSKLVALIESGAITEAEIETYFRLDEHRSAAERRPKFQINAEEVELGAFTSTFGLAGDEFALDARRAVRQRAVTSTERVRSRARGPAVAAAEKALLAEGDSWFNLVVSRSVIDALQQDGKLVVNIAHPGDTVGDMARAKQYLGSLKNGWFSSFLLSGGGNDIVDGLQDVLGGVDSDRLDPKNPSHVNSYIKAGFAELLDEVDANYTVIISDVRRVAPSIKIVLHGYAYAVPVPHGIFISPSFDRNGWALTDKAQFAMACAIIRRMIDLFYLRLSKYRNMPGFDVVDFRPVLNQTKPSDWYDHEMHPSPAAAMRMAKIYEGVLPALVA